MFALFRKRRGREVLLYKIDVVHAEAGAVQVFQVLCRRREAKFQAVCVEGLVFARRVFAQGAVFAVPQQGAARMGELGADLMGPAGDELAFDEAQAVRTCQGPVLRLGGLRPLLGLVRDIDAVFDGDNTFPAPGPEFSDS